jgi:hypothetical protein
MVMQTHQFLAIVMGLIPCDMFPRAFPRQLSCCVGAYTQSYAHAYVCIAPHRFAGVVSVPIVILGNLVYWPGYKARDRGKLGVYTCFQFTGLVYWAVVLAFPTYVLTKFLDALVWCLMSLVFLGVVGLVWVPEIWLLWLLHAIWAMTLALVILWILVPLNWLTCLIGAILGSIASCSEPYREGEAPPVVVLATIAADVDATAVVATAVDEKEVRHRNPLAGED